MYTKSKSKTLNKMSIITRYFDGVDITNSVLLKELPKLPSIDKVLVTSKRYDLLAQSLYNNPMYGWILQFYTGVLEEDLELGTYLTYPSLDSVTNLILTLDEYNK